MRWGGFLLRNVGFVHTAGIVLVKWQSFKSHGCILSRFFSLSVYPSIYPSPSSILAHHLPCVRVKVCVCVCVCLRSKQAIVTVVVTCS